MTKGRGRINRISRRHATRAIAVLSTGVLLLGLAEGPARGQVADDEFIFGSGRADARVFLIGPSIQQLSLSPTLGVALADYQGQSLGRGQSIQFDWAALDGEVESGVPDQILEVIDPILATTAASPECWDRSKFTPAEIPGAIEQHAQAIPSGPNGASQFFLPRIVIDGVLEISGGVARTTAGVLPGEIRQATAVTEIGRLSLGGGAVELKGLRWEAVHRSGAEELVTGSFDIEDVDVAGTGLGGLTGDLGLDLGDLLQDGAETLLGLVNEALEALDLGMSIGWPELVTDGGVARMTPLRLSISDSSFRQETFGPILGDIQPIREPIIEFLLELGEQIDDATGASEEGDVAAGARDVEFVGCPGDRQPEPEGGGGSSIPSVPVDLGVLVSDIALGLLSGISGFDVALGGTMAFTEGEAFDSAFGAGLGAPPVTAPVIEEIPGTLGTPPIPGTPQEDLVAAPSPAEQARGIEPGSRGGIAVLIGLIGLALALVVAGTDWYYIRRNRAALPTGMGES